MKFTLIARGRRRGWRRRMPTAKSFHGTGPAGCLEHMKSQGFAKKNQSNQSKVGPRVTTCRRSRLRHVLGMNNVGAVILNVYNRDFLFATDITSLRPTFFRVRDIHLDVRPRRSWQSKGGFSVHELHVSTRMKPPKVWRQI